MPINATGVDRNSIHGGDENRRPKPNRARVIALVGAELILFSIVVAAFWYQDLQYSLPTQRPVGWKTPSRGSRPKFAASFATASDRRPLVLNFYNAACPCSRFNLDHVRELAKSYGSRARFVLVMEGGTKADEAAAFRDLRIPAEPCFDSDGRVARSVGVYSTPQGAVLDSQNRLLYAGNYNVGRYCVDPRTEFVRIALESTVSGAALPAFMAKTPPAYGCAIPKLCKAWTAAR